MRASTLRPRHHDPALIPCPAWLRFVCRGLLIAAVSATVRADTLTLVQDGRAQATIRIPNPPSKAAQLGAFELQAHIHRITGVILPIERAETDDAPAAGHRWISIGDTALARRHRLDAASMDPRERCIRFVPEGILLFGMDEPDFETVNYRRGTPNPANLEPYDIASWPSLWSRHGSLLAVYDFLEHYCGVQWFTPGDDGTVYEPRATLSVFIKDHRHTSSFVYSRVPHDYLATTTPWHPNTEGHARYLDAAFPETHRRHDRETIRRTWRVTSTRAFLHRKRCGGEWFNANHSFAGFYARFWEPSPRIPEAFVEKRPALFAKGHSGRPAQLCLTEPATRDQFIADGRDFFNRADTPLLRDHWRRTPDSKHYFPIVPEDNVSWCRCDPCQAQFSDEPPHTRVNGHASEHVFGFVNAVARELKRSHPDKRVSTLAYWHYSLPPRTLRLEDNVAVQLCMQIRMPYATHRQRVDWEMANAWGREYPDMPKYIWAYYCFPEERSNRGPQGNRSWTPAWHCFPGFFSRTIANQFREYHRIHARGIFFNGFGYDVENYVTFALLDDVDQDVETILDTFFTGMFGPAAPALRRFYDDVERIFSDSANYPRDDVDHQTEYIAWGFLGTPARMQSLAKSIEDARRLAEQASSAEQRRIHAFILNFWNYMTAGRRRYEEKHSQNRSHTPRTIHCPFQIDGDPAGRLDAVNWHDAQALDLWRPGEGRGTTRRVMGDIIRDRTHLYVRLRELHPVRESPHADDYWMILWGDGDEKIRWELTVTPDGDTRTLRFRRDTDPGEDDLGISVQQHGATDGPWVIDAAIPLASLPIQNKTLLMQFIRGRRERDDWAMFTPMGDEMTEIEQFARIRLDGRASSNLLDLPDSDSDTILLWDFEPDTLTVRDRSGNGNHGRIEGPVLHESGPFGTCIRMRGLRAIANHVECPNLNAFTLDKPFTISFWVNLDLSIWNLENSSVHHTLVEIRDRLLIRIGAQSRPSVIASLKDGQRREISMASRPLTPLAWEHVAVTYESRRLTVYLNGRLAGQAEPVDFTPEPPSEPQLVLGRHSSGAFHRQFRGQLDTFRIDARAWTADEVLSRYRDGLKRVSDFHTPHSTAPSSPTSH